MIQPSPSPTANKQGRLADPTLSVRFSRWFSLIGLVFLLAQGDLPAQTGDDLSVPGLTDGLDAPKSATTTTEDGTVIQEDTTLFGLIAKGGWAMWILGLFSFTVVGLGIYCGIDLRKDNFCPPELSATLRDEMAAGNLEAVHEITRGNPTTLARMTAVVSEHIGETGYSTDDNDILREMMAEAGQKHNRQRAKIINYFSVLAQASPMMGLLGTVSGMIKAFGALGKSGMAKPEVLAEHISEALVTTAAGLVIALPAIFLYFFFRDRVEELITACEDEGVEMLNALRRTAFAAAEEARAVEAGEMLPPDSEP